MSSKYAGVDVDALLAQPAVTISDTASLLGLGRNQTYEAAARGEIPTIKIGRRLLVPTAALRRLLQMDDPKTAA